MSKHKRQASGLTCLHCTAPSTNGTVLCPRCQTTAEVSLRNIASYHADLFSLGSEVPRVRRRGDRSDPTGNAAGSDHEPEVVEVLAADTTAMLSDRVRKLLDGRPALSRPASSVMAMTAFLRQQLRVIATLDWAGDFVTTLLAMERRLHRTVSQHQGHWYAGMCGTRTGEGVDDWCTQDLFVHPGDRWLRCSGCGAPWTVEARRTLVIEAARDQLLPVSTIARAAVSLLGAEVSQSKLEARLRKWVERGLLDDYGVRVLDGRPRRVYRLGDVMDRLTREASGISA